MRELWQKNATILLYVSNYIIVFAPCRRQIAQKEIKRRLRCMDFQETIRTPPNGLMLS
jgi:hypothetical protein